MNDTKSGFRSLPRIDTIADQLPPALPRSLATNIARRAVSDARAAVIAAEEAGLPLSTHDTASIVAAAKSEAERLLTPMLRRVINATGVVLHTNLGRAPLAAVDSDGIGYTNLEFNLETGERGSRTSLIAPLLTALTGADAAIATNNTAAALMIAVATFAAGREVIIARGELVEIGDSFRLPEILECSGVHLREVGTTNRVTADDYARAISDKTGAILKVYPSNYKIVGFTGSPPIGALIDLAHTHGLPCLVDLGSDPITPLTLPAHADTKPTARELVSSGADIVMFSGDKELGGPQAGLIVGRADAVRRIARHPWMRAMRVDKLRLASLTDVLRAHLLGRADDLPTHRYLKITAEALEARANAIVAALGHDPRVETVRTEDAVGGGAHPDTVIIGSGLALTCNAHALISRLRLADADRRPPIIARVHEKRVILSLRAVEPVDDPILCDAIKRSLDTP